MNCRDFSTTVCKNTQFPRKINERKNFEGNTLSYEQLIWIQVEQLPGGARLSDDLHRKAARFDLLNAFETPMIFSSKRGKMLLGAGAVALAALSFGTARYAIGSDHAGTVVTAQTRPGTDLSDLHIFPGSNANNVVLAMSVRPLIPAGNPQKVSFDTDVLYQFKIDNTGDSVEDLVIQARFQGTGANQKVFISGPVKPSRLGTVTKFETAYTTTGTFNTAFSPVTGMRVFAGLRSDPFFIDLEQLFTILPDRADPLKPSPTPTTPPSQANTPKATTWRPAGQAQDFLANFNVLGLVVELPKSQLIGSGNGKIRVWETTSIAN